MTVRAVLLLAGLALVPPSAVAQEPACLDLAQSIDAAWTAFDDAELAEAAGVLDGAIRDLACQSRLIQASELFTLFELDALVALGAEDEERAVYAVIRAVTADPSRDTDAANGPKLAALHETWKRRLVGSTLSLRVAGEHQLHLDGRPIASGSTVELIEGEHLVQWQTPDGVHTEVRELVGDQTLLTSDVAPETLAALEATPTPPPPPSAAPEPTPVRVRKRAPGIPALWGTGLAVAALGGGAVTAGFLIEQDFAANPYDADVYLGCGRGGGCWRESRDQVIRRDATLIRVLYGGGYGLLGLGGTMTVVGLAVQPTRDGVAVALTVPL